MKNIKIIYICFLVLLLSCRKVEVIPEPLPPANTDIFTLKEVAISNASDINFNLKSDGVYILTLKDSATNQVLSRERFVGKTGNNKLKIYTKSFQVKYLYLLLEDANKVEIGKTTIIIK